MADYDISRIVSLELRLAVTQAKLAKATLEAQQLVDEVLGSHSNKDPVAQAKRLQLVLQELDNFATNLHK